MTKPNLFPNYQAALITASAKDLRTFETAEIKESRGWVKFWVEHLQQPDVSTPVQVAVVGDYGSGKTHLMLDAAATLLKETQDKAYILRLIAPESTPSEWFRMDSSPLRRPNRLEPDVGPPLKQLVGDLLTECAIDVLDRQSLTAREAATLRENPAMLGEVIAMGTLNPSELQETFRQKLQNICGTLVSTDVRLALEGLNGNKTAAIARDWLYGAALTKDQASTLRITVTQADDAEMMGLLVATAALFRHFNRPFALMIDELEHLAAYDRTRGEKKNLTWLKRLLEALAPTWALVFVAGHVEDAWTWETNLESRFKVTIRMLVLPPDEIVEYVKFVIGRVPAGLEENKEAFQSATGGKFREVLTLGSYLSDMTDGFEQPIHADQIRTLRGIIPSRAIDAVQGLLQQMGFSIQREATLAGRQFDLMVANNGEPVAIFDFRHTTTQRYPTQEVHLFIEKRRDVSIRFPKLVYCIVAEGNADPEITAAAQETGTPLRYFDTKTPEFLAQVRSTLEQVRTNQSAPPAPPDTRTVDVAAKAATIVDQVQMIDQQIVQASSEDNQKLLEELRKQRVALDQQMEDLRRSTQARDEAFLKRLQQLEEQRKQDFKELEERAKAAEREAPGSREAALAAAVVPTDPLEKAYDETTYEYRPLRAARTVWGNSNFLYGVGLIVFGIGIAWILPEIFWPQPGATTDHTAVAQASARTDLAYRTLVRGLGALMACAGLFLCIRRLMEFTRFYEHARRLLREVYIRSHSADSLALADSTLQEVMAKFGPAEGLLRAREELGMRLPYFRPGWDSPVAAASDAYEGPTPAKSYGDGPSNPPYDGPTKAGPSAGA
jgi:hypothetical protein